MEFLGTVGEIGVVAPGAPADLLVVDSNPLTDLSALRALRMLVLRGTLHERR